MKCNDSFSLRRWMEDECTLQNNSWKSEVCVRLHAKFIHGLFQLWKFAINSTLRVSSMTNSNHWTCPWIYRYSTTGCQGRNFISLWEGPIRAPPPMLGWAPNVGKKMKRVRFEENSYSIRVLIVLFSPAGSPNRFFKKLHLCWPPCLSAVSPCLSPPAPTLRSVQWLMMAGEDAAGHAEEWDA